MPSTSKSQQRLMGVAYAVKKGDMQLSDVDASYRDKVSELVDGMTLKQLKDFAETSHEGLPEVKEDTMFSTLGGASLSNLGPGMLGGMGDPVLPDAGTDGSGDVPAGQGDAKEEYRKKKKKRRKLLMTMEEFIVEKQLKAFSPDQPEEESVGGGDYEKGSVPIPDQEMIEKGKMLSKVRQIIGIANN